MRKGGGEGGLSSLCETSPSHPNQNKNKNRTGKKKTPWNMQQSTIPPSLLLTFGEKGSLSLLIISSQ